MTGYRIHQLDAAGTDAWNRFVTDHEAATFFHLAEWQTVLQRAFNFPTYYLYAKQDGDISGVLPLALVKRPPFGSALISTPLCVAGGAIGRDQATIERLEAAAAQKAKELNVGYLELRRTTAPTREVFINTNYAGFRRELPSTADKALLAIPRKQRAEVRKGMKAELSTRFDHGIDPFYSVYAESVRNLGTPVFSRKYAQTLRDVFGQQCGVLTVLREGMPLASVLSFYFRDEVLPYYGGGLPSARAFSAYAYMYWELMRDAVERGIKFFDFGRSMLGSGTLAFKKNWGFEPTPLYYTFDLVKATEPPNMSPTSARNHLLVSAWKKLPLPVSNRLGPLVYPAIV
jgi:FemAB-related protein (PEP-CTERM system-associated)